MHQLLEPDRLTSGKYKHTMRRQRIIDVFSVTLTIILSGLIIAICMFGMYQYIFGKETSSERCNTFKWNWGVEVNTSCSEIFHIESDHSGRGEGWRYYVYTGKTENALRIKEKSDISVTHGFGEDIDIDTFLLGIYQELNIPEEYYCSTTKSNWIKFQKKDGSILVIVKEVGSSIFVVEKLLQRERSLL